MMHRMEWEISADKLKGLLKPNVGEQLFVQRFNLGKSFLSIRDFTTEKKRLLTEINERVLNIRVKFPKALEVLQHFDPYHSIFGNTSSNWVPPKSSTPKKDSQEHP